MNSCLTFLKGSVSQDFWPFFPWFKPIWAPDKQAKVFLNSVLILPRYLITKLEKFDWVFLANCSFFCEKLSEWVLYWKNKQFARAGNYLICSSLICSFTQITQIKWATVSDFLRSLKTNEWLWANCSGCSYQKSDCERIAQVTHEKWATMSNSLRLLMINEQMSNLIKKIWLKLYFCCCFIYVFYFKKWAIRSFPLF